MIGIGIKRGWSRSEGDPLDLRQDLSGTPALAPSFPRDCHGFLPSFSERQNLLSDTQHDQDGQ